MKKKDTSVKIAETIKWLINQKKDVSMPVAIGIYKKSPKMDNVKDVQLIQSPYLSSSQKLKDIHLFLQNVKSLLTVMTINKFSRLVNAPFAQIIKFHLKIKNYVRNQIVLYLKK